MQVIELLRAEVSSESDFEDGEWKDPKQQAERDKLRRLKKELENPAQEPEEVTDQDIHFSISLLQCF